METTARDIMTSELITINESTSLEDALKLLINHKITGLPVVDDKGRLLGILSEYDIIAQISKQKRLSSEIFHDKINYTHYAHTVDESVSLPEIVSLFVKNKYRRVPVTDATGALIGIITRRDLMRIFYYRAKLQ